jgi:hypothetical protein
VEDLADHNHECHQILALVRPDLADNPHCMQLTSSLAQRSSGEQRARALGIGQSATISTDAKPERGLVVVTGWAYMGHWAVRR